MGKKSDKGPATVDQLFVLGLDENGKPRGARFAELKDNIASAAVDMNCRVLVNQPETVSDIAMNCPLGAFTPAGKRSFQYPSRPLRQDFGSGADCRKVRRADRRRRDRAVGNGQFGD